MSVETTILSLLIIASAVSMAVRRLHLPYTIALVIVGVVLGFFDFFDVHLTPHLLFLFLLPALLFEAAFHLEFKEVKENFWFILLFAIPGVLCSVGLVGILTYFGITTLLGREFTLLSAFLFGALISATDPVSVLSIFRELGVPKRLSVLMEGESLFNDGTAVVVFGIFGSIMGVTGADVVFDLNQEINAQEVILDANRVETLLAGLEEHEEISGIERHKTDSGQVQLIVKFGGFSTFENTRNLVQTEAQKAGIENLNMRRYREHVTVGWILKEFLLKVLLGGLVGFGLGYLLSRVTATLDDPLVEVTLTTILAYGSFVVAEHFHASGVIAVVVAGMMSGNYGSKIGMSPSTKIAVISFWEFAVFIANSVIFLLIGLEVQIGNLIENILPITVAWLALMTARTIIVNAFKPIFSKLRQPFEKHWNHVVVWGGLRGSLSMVLALSLPVDFEYRPLILSMTFGVVVITILFQGLTLKPLLSKLGIIGNKETDIRLYEEQKTDLQASNNILSELKKLLKKSAISPKNHEIIKEKYDAHINNLQEEIKGFQLEKHHVGQMEMISVQRHLLNVRKNSIQRAFREGMLTEESLKEQLNEADKHIDMLEDDAAIEERYMYAKKVV